MTFIAKAPKIDVRRLRKKKSYEAEEVLRRLNAFLDKNFEEPMKILRHFWQDQQDAMTYAELREAIKAGHLTDETARAWRHDYAKLVNDQFSHTWRNALALGPSGQPSMDNLTSFRLDMQKPGVLNWIGSRAADFVTNEVQEQKDAIRSVLMRGVTNQHTVDEMARVIRPLVGLNKPQTIANYNYYNHMVKTLTEQHPRTSAASIQARAQEAAVKYAEKQHRARAMMIARTELSFAYNRGAYEGVKQAQALGLMGAVVKIWSTSQGGNVCPECEALEGEEVGMDAPFFDSRGLFKGDNLVPPLHPRCYCAIVYQEVETNGNKVIVDDAVELEDYVAFEGTPKTWRDLATLDEVKDLSLVNPYKSRDNCTSCVVAYEMRQRGKAVHAGEMIKKLKRYPEKAWINPVVKTVMPGDDAKTIISSDILAAGVGARFQINGTWNLIKNRSGAWGLSERTGHSFIGENRENDVVFIDIQSGKYYNENVLLKFSDSEISYYRIDNLELSDLGATACKKE